VGLYGEQHPELDVLGIGVFLRGQDVPRNPTWASGPQGPLVCVALDRVLPDWTPGVWTCALAARVTPQPRARCAARTDGVLTYALFRLSS